VAGVSYAPLSSVSLVFNWFRKLIYSLKPKSDKNVRILLIFFVMQMYSTSNSLSEHDGRYSEGACLDFHNLGR